jgi:hypothetical protein
VVARGLLTKKQLRSSPWRRLRQDVYADAALPLTHRLLVSAVGLTLPDGAGFTGRSAAVLWGVRDIAGVVDPVEVVLAPRTRWNAGPGVRTRPALPGQRLLRRGLWRCASPVDTATDLVRWTTGDEAVVLLDRVCVAGMVQLQDVRDAVAALPPCRGSARARRAAKRADGLAESPPETRLRLLLDREGLPPPVAQFRVFDESGFIARVDFAYPELKVAIEYDGAWHGGRQAFLSDRRRLNRLVAAGWTVLHVTADDMRRPAQLAARVLALRAQRAAMINAR